MTKVKDVERWLAYALADGPLPARAGRIALVANFHPHSDKVLDRAKRGTGVTSEAHGIGPGRYWWRAPGDTRPISYPLMDMQCDTCHRTLPLPAGRICITTPGCRGWYRPQPIHPKPLPPRLVIQLRSGVRLAQIRTQRRGGSLGFPG